MNAATPDTSRIPLAIVTGGFIIAVALYVSLTQQIATAPEVNPLLVRPVEPSDHIFGNPSAKAIVIEYADFDCEFCKDFHTTLEQLVGTAGAEGEVAWVLRQFPLTEIHPQALSHARAAECAAEVGGNDGFWRFATLLYANQPVNPSTYSALAAQAKIAGQAFANCYNNFPDTREARIQSDRQNALDIGAQGAPFALILVSGKAPVVVNGAYPYDDLKALIDEALAP